MAGLSEIRVTFDADMAAQVCLLTSCTDGLCYRNARWNDARTLVIRIDPALQANHAYAISLGVPGRCAVRSRDGQELPVTAWEFRTR